MNIDLLPREKLLKHGPKTLSDRELLAVFLNTGTQQKSVFVIADELLTHYPSLGALLNASPVELCHRDGIGTAKAAKLQAILELCRRYLWEQAREQPVTKTSAALKEYLWICLKYQQRETFACLLLTPQLRVMHYEELFYGTLTQVPVYPREIVKLALKYNAHAVVLGHNHPDGTSTPSVADIVITQQIQQALSTVDILLIDHIIMSAKGSYSFAEHGHL